VDGALFGESRWENGYEAIGSSNVKLSIFYEQKNGLEFRIDSSQLPSSSCWVVTATAQ
jgi:hypothetical protein